MLDGETDAKIHKMCNILDGSKSSDDKAGKEYMEMEVMAIFFKKRCKVKASL